MALEGKKVLIFVQDEYEDLELQYPPIRMLEAGAEVTVAGPEAGKSYSGKHGYPCKADKSFKDVNADQFDLLIIPGGYAPDKLRRDPKVLEITRKFHEQGKPIAFICHAGWVPISAKSIKGVKCTSYSSIKDDMINAGANWVDESVVVDRNIISSRFPDDLPAFCQAILEHFESEVSVR